MRNCRPRPSSPPCHLHAWGIAASLICATATSLAYDETTQSYFPKLKPPRSLRVAKTWADSREPAILQNPNSNAARAEMILLQSLSGILLKQGCPEGIFIEPNLSHRIILRDLAQRRGLPFTYVAGSQTVWDLAARFQTNFGARYVRCDLSANPGSLSISRMAAHKFNAVIVDALIEATAVAHGWTNVFDASDKDDQWFATNWWPTWPIKNLAVEQNNDPRHRGDAACLNDYAAATGVPAFYQGTSTPLRRAFLSGLESDALLLGWPDGDELTFTAENSKHNVSLAAVNWCFNLALLSAFRDPSRLPLAQATTTTPPTETNVHYATFIFTDGDNVQWFHNAFLNHTQWWASPHRGHLPLGWGIPPTLRDLSPTIVEHLYAEAAASRPPTDVFLAMSPVGYCYPSLMSAETRATNAVRLARYMRDLDLRLLIVPDKAGFEKPTTFEPYLRQPEIEGIFYWDVAGDYAKYRGRIRWENNKPIISAFSTLWGEQGPVQVATSLNQRPHDSHLEEGYSVVAVHAWSHGVESVRRCIQLLGPQVRVVPPDVFVSLLNRNVGQRRSLRPPANQRGNLFHVPGR